MREGRTQCGFGSGAKAKVLEGVEQVEWCGIIGQLELFGRSADSQSTMVPLYEALHRGIHDDSGVESDVEFALIEVDDQVKTTAEGVHIFQWVTSGVNIERLEKNRTSMVMLS